LKPLAADFGRAMPHHEVVIQTSGSVRRGDSISSN
jgi:hypothetical protein